MEQPSVNLVALNPQPLPPDARIKLVALNPQPLPLEATINLVALNPNRSRRAYASGWWP